jgi:hypothetical protein
MTRRRCGFFFHGLVPITARATNPAIMDDPGAPGEPNRLIETNALIGAAGNFVGKPIEGRIGAKAIARPDLLSALRSPGLRPLLRPFLLPRALLLCLLRPPLPLAPTNPANGFLGITCHALSYVVSLANSTRCR